MLVLQFVLALFGFSGEHDIGHDVGGFDHDVSGPEIHAEVGHDVHAASHHSAHAQAPQQLSIFRALSLRTVVAALAFFGLAGRASQAAGCSEPTALFIAAGAGVAALYAVYFMLDAMKSLRAEGTVHIQRAVGKEATVYLRIPANRKSNT